MSDVTDTDRGMQKGSNSRSCFRHVEIERTAAVCIFNFSPLLLIGRAAMLLQVGPPSVVMTYACGTHCDISLSLSLSVSLSLCLSVCLSLFFFSLLVCFTAASALP